jgi:hypothetical protein
MKLKLCIFKIFIFIFVNLHLIHAQDAKPQNPKGKNESRIDKNKKHQHKNSNSYENKKTSNYSTQKSKVKLETENFGYNERKAVIEKCTNNLSNVYTKSKYKPRSDYYSFVMNHCFVLNQNLLQPKYKFFYRVSKFHSNWSLHRVINRPNTIKSSIKQKLALLPKEDLNTIYSCINIEKLSRTFFIHKSNSIKKSPEVEQKLFKFYKWLKNNGALFNKLDIFTDTSTGYRGMYALDEVSYNENMIYIPDKLIINCDKVEGSVVSKKIRKFYDKIVDYESIIIALFFIEEIYSENSFWKPFLEILPTDLSNFPLMYSDEELNLLKGYRMYNQIIKIRNRTRNYYTDIICPEAKTEFSVDYCSIVSYDLFLWAVVNVKSRAFGFNRHRLEIAGVSPLSDMLNHSNRDPSLLWRYSASYKGFVIFSFNSHHTRDEIFTSYGNIGNEWLLQNYGFVLPDNQYDEIHLKISLPTDDKNYYLKFVLLEKKGIKSKKKMALSMDLESTKTTNFLNIFRFIHYQENLSRYLDIHYDLQIKMKNNKKLENGEKIKSSNYNLKNKKINPNQKPSLKIDYLQDNIKDNEEYDFSPYKFSAVDIDEEVYMLKQLKILVNNHLKSFSTTLEEDENIFNKNKHLMSFNVQNIFIYRISQKKVLKYFNDFCDKMILLFKMNYKQFDLYFDKHKEELKPYEYYVEGTVGYLLSIYKS